MKTIGNIRKLFLLLALIVAGAQSAWAFDYKGKVEYDAHDQEEDRKTYILVGEDLVRSNGDPVLLTVFVGLRYRFLDCILNEFITHIGDSCLGIDACFLLKLRYYFFEIVQSKPYSSRAADFIIPAQICEYGYRLLSFIQRKYHCINLDPLFLHNH